jgi:hypothetical protein
MSKQKQLDWVAIEIKETEKYLKELLRYSRSLVIDSNFTPRVDERPDLPMEIEPSAFAD